MYIASKERYTTMEYNRCGDSGLMLPKVSLGLWHNFGDTANFENIRQLCFTAFDNGITQFDLANNYGPEPGSAEINFGRILKKGLITFSPLAQGQLTDRYLNGIPEDSRIRTDGRFLKESNLTPERLLQIRELNDMAAGRGEKLSEMALGWLLAQQEVTSVLIGASRPQQILDNIKAIHCAPFTEEELVRIDEIAAENTASMIMKSQIYPGA